MKTRHLVLASTAAVATLGAASLAWMAHDTQRSIDRHRAAVVRAAAAQPSAGGLPGAAQLAALPPPVQRYIAFTFPAGVPPLSHVEMEMDGRFRRPKTDRFTPTQARQTVAAFTPAMVFDATTPILPGVWARAYDAYVGGRMEMKAKILSAFAVVDEVSSPELDRISLRRWLLESPLYPVALLPGGPVQWQAIDERRARAVVSLQGVTASLVATFSAEGGLQRFDAETDGDLRTPYHGSGEHVMRSDWQAVDGMMIPMRFSIARAAGGQVYPFWEGRITTIHFSPAGTQRVAGR